ncbi:MAG: YaaR family protein [Bacteroides sp.]|nr:YaaR family protein [Prevotella sp.]MCM1407995.1 YaaR family protein [Treponema brennaborense]MCM1468971.1 YaaR family protein [Bacteroides sp.]
MSSIETLHNSLYFSGAAKNSAKKQRKTNERIRKEDGAAETFSEMLESAAADTIFQTAAFKNMPFEKILETLKDNVDIAAEKLKQKPYGAAFSAFRKAVGDFLKFAVENTYQLEQLRSSRIQRRVLLSRKEIPVVVQIKIINERLDKLAGDLLANYADQIKLAQKVDEITGLLVNLFT